MAPLSSRTISSVARRWLCVEHRRESSTEPYPTDALSFRSLNWSSLSPINHHDLTHKKLNNFRLSHGVTQNIMIQFGQTLHYTWYCITLNEGISGHKCVCPVSKMHFAFSTFHDIINRDDLSIAIHPCRQLRLDFEDLGRRVTWHSRTLSREHC